MTQGDVMQVTGLLGLGVGLFLLFGIGWAVVVVAALLLVAGELVDRRVKT